MLKFKRIHLNRPKLSHTDWIMMLVLLVVVAVSVPQISSNSVGTQAPESAAVASAPSASSSIDQSPFHTQAIRQTVTRFANMIASLK